MGAGWMWNVVGAKLVREAKGRARMWEVSGGVKISGRSGRMNVESNKTGRGIVQSKMGAEWMWKSKAGVVQNVFGKQKVFLVFSNSFRSVRYFSGIMKDINF